jgi:hypothetical protein
MRLNQNAIDEFRAIYKKQFGEEISEDDAQEMGLRLLKLFQIIYRPLPEGHECSSCNAERDG